MAKQFDLQARLKLVGPVNIKPIVSSIQSQLKNIKGNINVQLNRNFTSSLTTSNRGLQQFNQNLIKSTASAKTATTAFNNLARSLGKIRESATGINTSIKPLQQANKQLQEITDTVEDFGAKSALALKRNAAFLLPTTAIFAFITAAKKGIQEALEFDQEMVRLSQVSGKSIANLSGLKKEVTSLSTSLGVTSKELIKVSTTLAQAGFTIDDTKTVLKGLAQSTLAPTFKDIESTAEGVIAAFNQFKLKASDVESVLGSLNSVAAAYAVESDDLVTVIRRTGGAFKSAGGNLNELISLFTSVRQTTRESAETIATGFRTIFTRIQRPKTIEYLREFGIELSDLKGKFVGPYEAIRRLSEGLRTLDSTDLRFAGIIEELGGFRQVSKVIPLIQQFATAQEALGVAEAGTGSLARDAATAQQSLLVQIVKVKEEFNDLFRTISNDAGFKSIVQTVLSAASAFANLAKSITPILPLLAVAGTAKAFGILPAFGKGFRKGFATGGLVPGSGNTDSVPANLTPGEFVLKKSVVQKVGAKNLQKFANGGSVLQIGPDKSYAGLFLQPGHDVTTPMHLSPDKLSKTSLQGLLNRPDVKAQGVTKIKDIVGTPGIHFIDESIPNKFEQNVNNAILKTITDQVSSIMPPATAAALNENAAASSKLLLKNSGISSILGNIFEGFLAVIGKNIQHRSAEDFDFKGTEFGHAMQPLFGHGISPATSLFDAKKGGKDRGFAKQSLDLLRKATNVAALQGLLRVRVIGGATPQKHAAGGSITDTVPAMLTPGEFVFNKNAAQRIGYDNLNKLNRQGFAGGGRVGFKTAGKVNSPETYGLQGDTYGVGPTIDTHNAEYVKFENLTIEQLKAFIAVLKKQVGSGKALDRALEEARKANIDVAVVTRTVKGKTQNLVSAPQAKEFIEKQFGIITHKGIKEEVKKQQEQTAIASAGQSIFGRGVSSLRSGGSKLLSTIKRGGITGVLGVGAAAGFAAQALPENQRNIAVGAIGGATTGASIGSIGGPIGAVAGAVVGGLAGLASSFEEEANKIRHTEFDKNLQVFSDKLKTLDVSVGVSKEQESALKNIGSATNRLGQEDVAGVTSRKTLGGLSSNFGAGIKSFFGTVSDLARGDISAIDSKAVSRFNESLGVSNKDTVAELSSKHEQNILRFNEAIDARIRGKQSFEDIAKSPEFKNLALSKGIISLNSQGKYGAALQALSGNKAGQAAAISIGQIQAEKDIIKKIGIDKLRTQFDGLTNVVNKEVSTLQTLSQSFVQASQHLEKLDDAFVSTEDALKGTATALKLNESNSRVDLGAPGQAGRIKNLSSIIGGGAGSILSSKSLEIQNIATTLPGLLEEFANSDAGLNKPGEEFDASFLSNALGNSDLSNVIAGNLQKGGREILDLAKVDPQRAADQVFGPVKEAFQHILDDLNKSIVEGANKLSASFQHLSTITNEVAAISDRRAGASQASRLFGLQVAGKEASFTDLNSAFAAKQNRLLGGINNDPGAILQALTGGRAQERLLETQIRSNPALAGIKGGELADLKQANANLTEALNNLANPTEQLAAINERLATIEQRRANLAGAAANFNSGSFKDRLAQIRNISQAASFKNLSPEQRKLLAGKLSSQQVTNISTGLQNIGAGDIATDLQANSSAGQLLNPLFGFANQQRDQALAQKGAILAGAEGAIGAQQSLGLSELQRLQSEVQAATALYAQEVSKATQEANATLGEVARHGATIAENLAKIPTHIEHNVNGKMEVTFNGLAAFQELQPALQKFLKDQLFALADKETGVVKIGGIS